MISLLTTDNNYTERSDPELAGGILIKLQSYKIFLLRGHDTVYIDILIYGEALLPTFGKTKRDLDVRMN